MDQLNPQDTTQLIPLRQDTLRIQDSIPVVFSRGALSDLDSVMNQLEIREETISIQKPRPLVPAPEPEPPRIFYYSVDNFWEGYTAAPAEKAIVKPAKKTINRETVPMPVLENEKLEEGQRDGQSYLQYLKKSDDYYQRTTEQLFPGWVLYILLFSILTLTLLKMAYTKFFEPLLNAIISQKEATQLYSNRNSITQNTFFILHFLFILNASLFLYLTGSFFKMLPDIHEFYLLLLFSAGIYLLYQLKFLLLYLLGFFFDQIKAFAEYIHNISLFNKFLGILLIPIMAGMAIMNANFTPYFLYTGLAVIVLLYLIRIIRGAGIILEKGFSVFYMFLYLCALEIFPLLIVYKLLELKLV